MRLRFAIHFAFATAAASSFAQGGPPLLTDDTGTVPLGKWEFNLAWTSERSGGAWRHEAPIFDFNRGVNDRTHVNFEVPWVFVSEGGRALNGLGNGGVGCKWRFVDARGSTPAVSIHPAIEFRSNRRSARLRLAEEETSFTFPVAAQWDCHRVGINAEAGVVLTPHSPRGWVGGLALGRSLGSNEVLAEVHAEGVAATGESLWLAQFGLRHELSEASTLLFAFGRSIAAHKAESVRWTSYLALQRRF